MSVAWTSANTSSFRRPLADSVRAHQRVHGYAVLREPPRVFQCRGRRLDALHIDAVAQRVEHRVDVAADAGPKQLDTGRVLAEFGNLVFEVTLDDRGHMAQLLLEPGSDLTDTAVNVSIGAARHIKTVDPRDPARWLNERTPLSPGHK